MATPPKDPCNDTVIVRAIALFQDDSAFTYKGPHAVASAIKDGNGRWRLLLAIQRDDKQFYYTICVARSGQNADGPQPDSSYVWALVQLGETVWEVMPSVHLPGQLHAYVTLVRVPSPAPWE